MLKLKPLLLPLFLFSLSLVSEGCVTIQNAPTCAVAGDLSGGGICSHLLDATTLSLSFTEMVDFLDAQPDRSCVQVPGMPVCADDQSTGVAVKLPARGAAIVMSAADWGTMKTELEVACRELGKGCSYAVQKAVANMTAVARLSTR
jgi:hypothetical protein